MVVRISKNRIHTDTSVVLQGPVNYAATSGTDTYTADPSPALTAYVTGAHYFISFGTANTSTTPTLNLNSLGAKTIVKEGTTALAAGDIPAGHKAILMYDGTYLVLMNPKAVSAPSGSITMHGGSSAPTGWLLCDGTAVSRTTYAALFTIVGTTYGTGNGSTTFNLPDIRGRAPIGAGQGSGLTNRGLAATGGAETHTLSIAEMPAHTHNYTRGVDNNAGSSFATPASAATAAETTTSTGGGGAHNNMQPFLVLNYIIKT